MFNEYLPMDVPAEKEGDFLENFKKCTGGRRSLMLFAGDQKVEHLNNHFYGKDIVSEYAVTLKSASVDEALVILK